MRCASSSLSSCSIRSGWRALVKHATSLRSKPILRSSPRTSSTPPSVVSRLPTKRPTTSREKCASIQILSYLNADIFTCCHQQLLPLPVDNRNRNREFPGWSDRCPPTRRSSPGKERAFRPFIPPKSESAVRQFAFTAAGHAVFRTLARATADLLLTYKYTVPAVNTTVNPHRMNESWFCSGPGDLGGGPGPPPGRGGSRLRACC